ncbi:hypothetical protein BaRGS_00040495 [Batillaria attramentaria]|uniref:Uncharacterized protein n=1 Tax=Batillaria attramentaria TaxID=370345 RepID=A0ABD0J062_9CAEN
MGDDDSGMDVAQSAAVLWQAGLARGYYEQLTRCQPIYGTKKPRVRGWTPEKCRVLVERVEAPPDCQKEKRFAFYNRAPFTS